ncbi:hypothetical protein [Prevotella sp. 10(H)]|uniref:hypothetical protein n=1 Tax=Prevotella sp. 10(H) TaxID=1158294 RepID=UPI0004A776CC|nr:hypothetical protein [Prevotella sp. 10(H)]
MIYEIKKNDMTLLVDDNVFFDKQPKEFKSLYEDHRYVETTDENGNVIGGYETDSADVENYNILVLKSGRVIITKKQTDYEMDMEG